MVQAKDPPSHYLTKLRTYLDPTASKSHRVSTAIVNRNRGNRKIKMLEIHMLQNE